MALDINAIKRKIQELQMGRKQSNVQLWKPKPAEYKVRGLPWPAKMTSDGSPMLERFFYYFGDNSILAPHQFGKPDPIHDFTRKLYATGKQEDKDIAKQLKPKMRAYLPVIVREGPGADPSNVLVWSLGKQLYQKLLSYFTKSDVGDFLDPSDGFDIEVSVKEIPGKRFFDTTIDLARRSSKLAPSDDDVKKLFDAIPNIDDMYKLRSPDEIEKILNDWLSGDHSGDGTEKVVEHDSTSKDALEELAREVGTPKKEEPQKKQNEEKPNGEREAKPAVRSLDSVFDDLMTDDK